MRRNYRAPWNAIDVTPDELRTLLALVHLQAVRPAVSMRNIAAETDQATSTVHHHLHTLRRLDFVDWETGRNGTVRSKLHATRWDAAEYHPLLHRPVERQRTPEEWHQQVAHLPPD